MGAQARDTQGLQTDLRDLRERLSYIASGDAGSLLTVVGSGVSRGAVASTEELTERFLSALSPSLAEGVRQRWKSETPAYARYQQAAEAVCRQRGDRALTSIIRSAVAEALEGDAAESIDYRAAVRELRWKVPKAHRDLALFYSRLPANVRAPIITTNFDPLIEVALRDVGISADPIPISFDDPPSLAQIRNANSVPVIHIHGYFTESWSINALTQIDASRQNLEGLLSSLFVDASVFVLGYGGWEDSFMRVLSRHASAQSVLNAEVIWCAHAAADQEIDRNEVLRRLTGSPGFQLYGGIDAGTLFDSPLGVQAAPPLPATPRGWTNLPVAVEDFRDPVLFSEGASPSWSDALPGRWPLLGSASELLAEARSILAGSSEMNGLAAIGPLGEGKSTALLQVATLLAEETSWNVLARGTGAPPLSREWLAADRERLGDAIFCIDEADIAADDVELLLSFEGHPRTLLLLAAQDRLWWSLPQAITRKVSPVLFDGFVESDAEVLAKRWKELGVSVVNSTRDGQVALSVDEVREKLILESRSAHNRDRTTLFGAILSTQGSSTLTTRIDELMDRLSRSKVHPGSKLSLAEVYGAICLMQVTLDRDGQALRGATRALIGQMVNGDDSLENVAVLSALGREASITFAGRHVYARHPLIADAAVGWLSRSGVLAQVAVMCGRAGARLRVGGAERSDYQDAYMIGRQIEDSALALSACIGAIEGAPDLIEPRITYVSVARSRDLDAATKYARGIVPLLISAVDARSAVRVFLNELARVELRENRFRIALGVAGLILHNGSGTGASREQMEYGLGTIALAYRSLLRQHSEMYARGSALLQRVSELVMLKESRDRYVMRMLPPGPQSGVSKLPLAAALDRLAREITPLTRASIEELGLPFGAVGSAKFVFGGGLDFSELRAFELASHR